MDTQTGISLNEAISRLSEELKVDSGLFYSWQSNIAMGFVDELSRNGYKLPGQYEMANRAAISFLDFLIKTIDRTALLCKPIRHVGESKTLEGARFRFDLGGE